MNRRFYSVLAVCFALALLIVCPISASATVTLSPSTYNFGTVAAGTGSAWVPFTLTNTGSSAVTISSAAVSGPFNVFNQCASSVAASSSCIIYVYFYPTSSSAATGTLTVTDSAGSQTSALSGNGGGGTTPTQVATPVISPGSETFSSSVSVTITDSTSGATIYYTTNGTVPTTSSTKYSSAITVSATETIEALAVKSGDTNSAVASATFTKSGGTTTTVATPVLSPGTETFTTSASVTITDSTSGATIYYTTNGSAPTTSSTKYSSAITVKATETIQAIAVKSGDTNSAVASATYTLNTSTGGGTTLNNVYTTFYGFPDNSPPSNQIAYAKSSGYPTLHNVASGTGNYADPITFATAANGDDGGQDPTSGEEAVGTIVYYPRLQKYFILEDECSGSGGSAGPSPGDSGNCELDWTKGVYHFDLWIQSNASTNADDVENCENDLTSDGNTETFIINPPSTETVNTVALFNSSTNTCFKP